MTLTRARVIFATGGFGHEVTDAVRSLLADPIDPDTSPRGRGDAPASSRHRGRGTT